MTEQAERTWTLTVQLAEDDPEPQDHQLLAASLYGLKKASQEPLWADLPRQDRVTYYSLTDGLV